MTIYVHALSRLLRDSPRFWGWYERQRYDYFRVKRRDRPRRVGIYGRHCLTGFVPNAPGLVPNLSSARFVRPSSSGLRTGAFIVNSRYKHSHTTVDRTIV